MGTIGGSVEVDEAPETSAVREAAEEAGVTVEITELVAAQGGPQFRATYPNGDVVDCRRIPFDGARWDYNALTLRAR